MRKLTIRENLDLLRHFIVSQNKIRSFPYIEQPEIEKYQFTQIKKLLDIAYYHTRFYKKKFDSAGIHPRDIRSLEDFTHLPTTTKEELIEYNPDFIDDRLDPGKLICSRSSGSSGKFVNLYYTADTFITQELQVLRMLRDLFPKYSAFDKELLVYTSEYPISSVFGLYKVIYKNNLLNSEMIINAIKSIKPAVIAIYPSILREILKECDPAIFQEHTKLILLNSEQSSQLERDNYARICGCNVYDEFSSEELLSIACQCPEKKYHLVQDCSYIELLKPGCEDRVSKGEEGEIVGTNLINFAMPVIRYRQGDAAILGDPICACGKTSPVIDSFSGRINSSFKKADGTIIASGKILDWTYSLVLSLGLGILEFEIIQKSFSCITARIVVNGEFVAGRDDKIFADSFRFLFGSDTNIDVHIVPDIPKPSSGKHIPIRSFI